MNDVNHTFLPLTNEPQSDFGGENDRQSLLQFSARLSLAMDRSELGEIITDAFISFNLDEYLLAVFDSDGPDHSIFLYKFLPENNTSDSEYHLDSLLRQVSAGDMTETPLNYGKKNIGILWTRAGKTYGWSFSMICSLVGLALANCVANERIEQHVAEIKTLKDSLGGHTIDDQQENETSDPEIIGAGTTMKKVLQMVSQVSKTETTVLILGETGTGKELIAHEIHRASFRKDRDFINVNCGALSPSLIESELFGHEKGSFTGAIERHIGKWELANNGTLFLDEIGELPFDMQVKLLRAIQEKEIERVGGKTVIKTNVRIIAATSRNLQVEVREGRFRSDLFFRLNVFPILIPPLRERRDDIPALAFYFLERYAKKTGKNVKGISSKVMKVLMAYQWPGNIRELEHLIERSILLSSQPVINHIDLSVIEFHDTVTILPATRIKTIQEVEREHIIVVLNACKGRVAGPGGAAEMLRIPPTTLKSKLKRLGIRKKYSDQALWA